MNGQPSERGENGHPATAVKTATQRPPFDPSIPARRDSGQASSGQAVAGPAAGDRSLSAFGGLRSDLAGEIGWQPGFAKGYGVASGLVKSQITQIKEQDYTPAYSRRDWAGRD